MNKFYNTKTSIFFIYSVVTSDDYGDGFAHGDGEGDGWGNGDISSNNGDGDGFNEHEYKHIANNTPIVLTGGYSEI
jgi:hypothetical protein